MSLQINEANFVELITNGNESTQELLAEYLINSLKLTRDVINGFLNGLKGAEKAKYEAIKTQVEHYLEQLEKSKNAGGLAKFFKALGGLGVALAFLTAVLIPTPMTISLLVVSVVMFLEPLISNAAGADSLLEKGMNEMFQGLSEIVGPIGAAILGAVIILVATVACAALLARGLSMFSAFANAGAQTSSSLATVIPSYLARMMNGTLTPAQNAAVIRFLEYIQSAILMAQGGVQIEMSKLQYEVAIVLAELGVEQAVIDGMTHQIEIVTKDMSTWQSVLHELETANLFS